MKNRLQDWFSGMRVWAGALVVLCVLVISTSQAAQAQTYKILFQFRAGADGAGPFAGGGLGPERRPLRDDELGWRIRLWGGIQAFTGGQGDRAAQLHRE